MQKNRYNDADFLLETSAKLKDPFIFSQNDPEIFPRLSKLLLAPATALSPCLAPLLTTAVLA